MVIIQFLEQLTVICNWNIYYFLDDEKVVSDLLKSSMSWETEKLAAAVELSEEEQSRILAEYEKELMERERSGSDEGLEEVENVISL